MSRRVIPLAVAPAAPTAGATPVFTAQLPLTLYLHMPWCVKKCPYCDFNSHEVTSPRRGDAALPPGARRPVGKPGTLPGVLLPAELEAEYIAALIADLEAALPQVWGRPFHAVFIGGGTPSLFSAAAYDTLLAAVRARVNLLPDAEVTLEANPGTVEAERFAGYRAAGVNRVSLGIQSFDDVRLQRLGRIHSSDEARRAIDVAQRHFGRVNLDLMYALPGQSLAGARADIEAALAFGTEHLSAYHLTLEPNTPFHHDPPPIPDEDIAADMQDMVEETSGRCRVCALRNLSLCKAGGAVPP
jgi:coproporphyrinogen III oxidase-like Fe-S oxidoreductase